MSKNFGFIAFLLVVVLLFSLLTVGYSAAEDVLVLRYGELNPETHIMAKVGLELIRIIEEKSNGKIKVEFYPGSQLGDERTQLQTIQLGALDLFRTNATNLGDFGAKKMNVVSLPYIFRDRDHLWDVLNSELGEEIMNSCAENNTGMIALGGLDEGARDFFFTKKCGKVESLADLKGAKIRVQQSEIMMDMVKALGAFPTPISWGEVYSALQTGVVDGAENPPTGYLSQSFQEVAPYYIRDGHTYSPSFLVVSEKTWEKLTDEQKRIIEESVKEAQVYNKRIAEEEDIAAIEKMKGYGVEIVEVPDKTPWQEAVQPLYEKYGAEFIDLIKKIQAK